MPTRPPGVPRLLRRLAALLVRGPDAPCVLGDLDEAYTRDVRRGLPAGRAGRRYLRNTLGSAASLARARLRVPHFAPSAVDLKLGVRMLRKQPALTAVAVFALSVGIPVGLLPFHMGQIFSSALPLEEGERIVTLRVRDLEHSRVMPRPLRDYHVWRQELTSFEAIGAAARESRNVMAEDGRVAPVPGAAMTASVFAIVRVAPLLGRPLVESDEVPGAPDVVVIGYDLWQARLAGDPDVVGRTIRIGSVPHEVVGVMPEGFLFPSNQNFWTALRTDPLSVGWGEGPWLTVVGRLSPGVTEAQANAELFILGQGIAAEHPETHRYLRAEVTPFTDEGIYDTPVYWLLQFLALALLAVACGNVGTLILARTAMRSSEIAVRTALGASRARVVSQIFIEALVLALLGAGCGLLLGDVLANRLQVAIEPMGIPFWLDLGLRWQTTVMALGLAAFSATIAGVIPGLKATGRDVRRSLQRAAAGVSGIRFGGVSTALIVAEVALATAFLSIGAQVLPSVLQSAEPGMGIAAEEYLSARVGVVIPERVGEAGPADTAAARAAIAATDLEIRRRVAAAPGVRGVALANSLPGEDHRVVTIEVEGAGTEPRRVRVAHVDVGFFRGLGASPVQGRDFQRADVADTPPEERRAVVVNTSFVENVLHGGGALGRRIRYAAREDEEPGPWLEIVGVVGHLGMNEINPEGDEGFYVPAGPGELIPGRVAIHLAGDPLAFVPELRRLVAEVDPDVTVREPRTLDDNAKLSDARMGTFWLGGVLVPLVAGVAIVLSAAGLFALVSFTVSERRREIGIRTALGARSSDIVRTIARRAFLQLAGGIAAGLVLRRLMDPQVGLTDDSLMHAIGRPTLFAATAAATLAIGLLACVPPLLRGLRIQPVDVLKEVG
ncbi:MAG: hypothetical protein AMXMBFR53_27950 [Gemmatimonadota bacterium]